MKSCEAERHALTRREFLAASGALIVGFSLASSLLGAQQPAAGAKLPGSLDSNPMLDSWIRIGADGSITVFTGKAELGQGVRTALIQIAAEQLYVPPQRIRLITADTRQTPDEGYTAGSNSMKDSGTAIMNAAAQVREILIARASERLGVAADRLKAQDGAIIADDGRRLGFGELAGNSLTRVRADGQSKLKDPATYTVVGKAMPRVDIPAKVSGGAAYVQDLRLPGMVHARVVRPPSYGARLRELQTSAVEKMPGVLKVLRDGSFVAVVAAYEFEAVQAMRALATAARWDEQATLPDQAELYSYLQRLPADNIVPRHAGARQSRDAQPRGQLPPPLPDARRDRTFVRGRPVQGRRADRMDAQPGRLSAAQIDRRNAAPGRGSRAMHPRRGFRLLRSQRGG
jgi:hypothetical protein